MKVRLGRQKRHIWEANFNIKSIPATGVLIFNLSTSMIKSSFKKRNPMMEKR